MIIACSKYGWCFEKLDLTFGSCDDDDVLGVGRVRLVGVVFVAFEREKEWTLRLLFAVVV